MADEKTLQIQAISAHPGSIPGKGMQRDQKVAKLIDVTSCIRCKACEVACMEWNGLPFGETTFDNTYQTMPETRWNYWNLIKFNEQPTDDGGLMWLMRKDQCMHCADPRSEEHTSELQSRRDLVCRLLLEKKKKKKKKKKQK